ncbi:hypothetical protein NM208_g8041 [Fusarium decemcellulare]|uniref:Uncharacterized protein n=1 Tax=Fusarium decemcellulare TaxID=57161 RepID=A0ACC1S721_9HYPO|nr:hypothetical protein NM208_g8041 [Fusarium decemcellulare]
MDASDSDLSKYGVSFVVSTTQLSINSAMEQYLFETKSSQPDNFLCFLTDPVSKDTSQIDLNDLKTKTGGIDPFEIPDGTPMTDPRVQTLTKSGFAFGIKMRMGLPPKNASGKSDLKIPPIVELRDSAQDVIFRMFCSELQVAYGLNSSSPSWNVWSQQPGSPCYAETVVDLKNADLDKELNTAYFNQNPDLKTAMQTHIENMSDTAFSLQQLLFDLDSVVLQTNPSFVGVPDNVRSVLEQYFVTFYIDAAKSAGEPLIAITPVPQDTPDPSPLQMTSFERQVSKYKDANGDAFQSPTPEQAAMSTLDHICMTGGTPLPDYTPFPWNWVQTQEAKSQGGVVAISREVFWKYLHDDIFVPAAYQRCLGPNLTLDPDSDTYHIDVAAQLASSANNVTEITSLEVSSGPNQTVVFCCQGVDKKSTVTEAKATWDLEFTNTYSMSVTVQDSTTLFCNQSLVTSFTLTGSHHGGITKEWNVSKQFPISDVSTTDTYKLSVGQDGSLQIVVDSHQTSVAPSIALTYGPEDVRFEGPVDCWPAEEATISWNGNVMRLNTLAETLRGQISPPATIEITSVNFPGLKTFVFPGAKVAAYSSAMLSKNYDLICNISYVDAAAAIPVPQPQAIPSMEEVSQPPPVVVPTQQAIAVPTASQALTLSSSTHMIQNYVHGSVADLAGKFEAVQTDDGHSLLFAMDKTNVLNVVVENSGTSKTGWMRVDLSSSSIKQNFANSPNSAVRTFDVCQDVISGTIGMTMVVTSQGADNLFVSLGNSNTGSSWMSETGPSWTQVGFDVVDDTTDASTLTIVGTMFEGTASDQFIIVDVDQSSDSSVKDIVRYLVHPNKPAGKRWTHHQSLPDLQDNTYQSCVGMPSNGTSKGTYNSGTTGNAAQLEFVPFHNPFGGPPTPSRFTLPSNAIPSAIAVTKNPDHSTDLYIIGGSALHRLPADGQQDGAMARILLTNNFFSGTTKLSAMVHDGVTTVWGKNGGNMVFYVTCPNDQLNTPTAWSTPLPLECDVDLMSSYVNQSTGSNTIFTSGGTNLQRMVQATNTEAKMWKSDDIKVDAALTEKAISFNSYTTTIQVETEQSLPASCVDVTIKAASHMPAYVNGTYYVLSQNATTVQTDKTGIVTIVEAINASINGTILTVSCDNWATSTTVNPMHDPFQKMATLNTDAAVLGAQYPATTIAGGITGTPKKSSLVSPSTDLVALGTTASTMKNLGSAYSSINSPAAPASAPSAPLPPNVSMSLLGGLVDGLEHGIESTVGDITKVGKAIEKTVKNAAKDVANGVKTAADDVGNAVTSAADEVADAVQHAVQIVKNTVTGVMHLVLKIADQVYHAALTTVDAIVGAVEWVFHAVETAIEDIIQFLEFLFEWDDIKRTKNFICNLTKQWVSGQIGTLSTAQAAFDKEISSLESSINQWAGVTDWSTSLGDVASQPVSAKASNPAAGQTSSSQMFANHFKTHATQITVVGAQPSVGATQDLFSDLLTAMKQEGDVLDAAYQSLASLANDITSLSLTDILQKLVAIIGDTLLSSVQTVVDALFKAIISVSTSAVSALDTTIHIPVISDILSLLDISEISFLDVICWVGAVAYTIVYKIAHDKAPFPEDDAIDNIINAQNWDYIKSQLPTISPSLAQTLYVSLHGVDSFMTFLSAFITGVEAEQPEGNSWGKWATITGGVGGVSGAVANMVLAEDPLQGSTLNDVSSAIAVLGIATDFVLSHSGKEKQLATDTPPCGGCAMNGRATKAIVDAVMVIPPFVITGIHLSQLGHDQAGIQRSAAIVGEVANITGYISKVAYAVAVNDPEPDTKEAAIGVMVLDILAEAGLKATQSMIVSGALTT